MLSVAQLETKTSRGMAIDDLTIIMAIPLEVFGQPEIARSKNFDKFGHG